ncbi:MAG: hypothetical protein J6Y84_02175 [Bacteroidaceae bacterium]|nr:hypothetical protein [Bacteroidaceae bacterium]
MTTAPRRASRQREIFVLEMKLFVVEKKLWAKEKKLFSKKKNFFLLHMARFPLETFFPSEYLTKKNNPNCEISQFFLSLHADYNIA